MGEFDSYFHTFSNQVLMKFYKIRYRTTDKIKTVQILAESPAHAKQVFKASNPFSEIVTCVLA